MVICKDVIPTELWDFNSCGVLSYGSLRSTEKGRSLLTVIHQSVRTYRVLVVPTVQEYQPFAESSSGAIAPSMLGSLKASAMVMFTTLSAVVAAFSYCFRFFISYLLNTIVPHAARFVKGKFEIFKAIAEVEKYSAVGVE